MMNPRIAIALFLFATTVTIGSAAELTAEDYKVTFTPDNGKEGRLVDIANGGFHVSTGEGTFVNFHRILLENNQTAKNTIEKWKNGEPKDRITKEREGDNYALYAWQKTDSAETNRHRITVFCWWSGLLFRIDWFATGFGKYDGEKIVDLLPSLKIERIESNNTPEDIRR